MGVDFLLIDEKSTVMQGSIYITHLHKFEDALRDGAIYTISAFDVTRSNTRLKLSDFHFSICFTAATLFVEAEESLCLIPKEFFRIKTHEELLRLANTNMELPDVMGEIVSTKVYRNGMSETLERMLVHMRLASGEKVRLSAFDDHATSLDKFFSKKEEGTFILLATNINPKIFGGELYLNATSGTKFYGDGDCTTTQQFAERLKGRDKDGTNSIAPYHGVEKIEHVSIEELNQFLATANPEEAEFLCTATVTDIQSQHGWSFISCGECGTKMVKKEASLACNNYKCGSTSAIGDVKYRVELVVNDGMSNGVFVAFDKDMVKLTNIQATTLTSQMVDTHQNSESDPHAHILLWLEGTSKNPEPAVIDKFISAELPDQEEDPEGFQLVEQHMMHGPCGLDRPYSPCMENGVCSKKFPRKFVENTTIDKSGYVVYRRHNDESKSVLKGGTRLDNQHVVPHNLPLLKKYKGHINVEWCCKTSAVKYLFKYITKGVDKATFVIVRPRKGKEKQGSSKEEPQAVDEISEYLDCRYVSACEAVWRIFAFHIHYHKPAVIRLQIHLQDQHRLLFDQRQRLQSILTRDDVEKTMLTEWMANNKREKESPSKAHRSEKKAFELTYVEFPKYYVWNTTKTWSRRKQGLAIGRIVHIHPSAGDLFYFRVLLNIVKGPTCFDDIKTVAGVIYATYKEACYVRGLLDDDKEWHDVLKEASFWATAYQLRYLFVTLLIYCEVAKPRELWDKNWRYLAEDVQHNKRKVFNFSGLELKDIEMEQYALIEIE
ncbi:PREDICTED: uncharacterized protein LOC104771684 isoform X2 [Camelina sativa]|nr:PREDICTED: uncharacterized protein LOC104771684 isoform X2 [Camelina sativa]